MSITNLSALYPFRDGVTSQALSAAGVSRDAAFPCWRYAAGLVALVSRTHPKKVFDRQGIELSMQKCVSAGMDDYISKPLSPEKLTTIIKDWLGA